MSDRKAWSYETGAGESRVVVDEVVSKGGRLVLRWWDKHKQPPNWTREHLGRVVERDARGNVTAECIAFAVAAAQQKSLELAGALPAKGGTAKALTVGRAEALITDKDTGKYPHRSPFRDELVRAIRLAVALWGAETPWEQIDESHWTLLLRRRLEGLVAKEKKAVRATEITVSRLITVVTWLRDTKRIPREAAHWPREWKKDVTKHWKGLTGSDRDPQPDRLRYTLDEFQRILAASDFDPRLNLLLRLAIGLRPGQVSRARRSDLKLPDVAWDTAVAGTTDFGSFVVHGAGKKGGVIVDLTRGQREAIDHALTGDGYLAHMELRYRAKDVEDYPLFPSGFVIGRVALMRGKESKLRLADSVDFSAHVTGSWIRKNWRVAEDRAGIPHIHGRATYGQRRLTVDLAVASGMSPSGIQAAGGWSDSKMPLEVYAEGENKAGRREARPVRAKMLGEEE